MHKMSERNMKMSESKEKRKELASKCRFKSICIFGETDEGRTIEFLNAAQNLGYVLAARKMNFIYGGGVQGLKGSVAMSATMQGSKGMHVRVKELECHTFSLGTELQVSSLSERMGYMLYNAEAFIALPGGLETLDAISSITYWAKLNFHKKPLGLLNVNGFYDSLLSFLDHSVEKGFIPQATRQTIISAPTAAELIDLLQTYKPIPDPLPKLIVWQSSDSSRPQDPDTTLRL